MADQRRLSMLWFAAVAMVMGTGCGGQDPITTCKGERGIRPICKFQNPEDLALLEDGRTVVVSQLGEMTGGASGSIALFDFPTEILTVVYPSLAADSADARPTPGWGDPTCPRRPGADFNPHGIDVGRRPDGKLQLLVTNHGEIETVEFFEIIQRDQGAGVYWRGCAVPPEGLFFNDIVNDRTGGFLATHMLERSSPMWGFIQARFGVDTGAVYEWQPEVGFRMVPGTEAPFPNGIELSPDGREIYYNVYGTGEIRRFSRASGEILTRVESPSPDNLTWADDGRLLVAVHTGPFADQVTCKGLEMGACPLAFEIRSLDPETLEAKRIFANSGPPMGGGTVAVQVGDSLLIGTFKGDRIVRVKLPHASGEES